jgi:hypothetical protein
MGVLCGAAGPGAGAGAEDKMLRPLNGFELPAGGGGAKAIGGAGTGAEVPGADGAGIVVTKAGGDSLGGPPGGGVGLAAALAPCVAARSLSSAIFFSHSRRNLSASVRFAPPPPPPPAACPGPLVSTAMSNFSEGADVAGASMRAPQPDQRSRHPTSAPISNKHRSVRVQQLGARATFIFIVLPFRVNTRPS